MFDEKQLQNLKTIHVDRAVKDSDFEAINHRLNKKPFYWQIPAVALSIVLLVLFLAATTPLTTTNPDTQLSSDAYLTEILVRDGASDPKSIYYIGVQRSVQPEELKELQQTFATLEEVAPPNRLQKPSQTYRLHYSNGDELVLQEFNFSNPTYYKNIYTEQYYAFADGGSVNYFIHTKTQLWQYVLFAVIFLVLFGGNWYIDKNMRVEGDPKRKLPMHSDYTQSITMVGYFFILFFVFVGGLNGNGNIHIVWVYLLGFIYAGICITIERKYDNNGWRKLRFINNAFFLPMYLFLVIQL